MHSSLPFRRGPRDVMKPTGPLPHPYAEAERLGQLVDPWLREPRPHVLVITATQATGRALAALGGVQVVPFDDQS